MAAKYAAQNWEQQWNMYEEWNGWGCPNGDEYCVEYQDYQKVVQQQVAQYGYYCDENDYKCTSWREGQQEYYKNKFMYSYEDDNKSLYIGPQCDKNGKSISFAVFQDEYCTVPYSELTVTDVLGESLSGTGAILSENLFPSKCVSCLDAANNQWTEFEESDDVEPMCAMLYENAAKCHYHLKDAFVAQYTAAMNANNNNNNNGNNQNGQYYSDAEWQAKMYDTQQQASNENAVCSFIEMLNSGTYNSNGQIDFHSAGTWNPFAYAFGGNKAAARNAGRYVSRANKIALWFLGLGIGTLLLAAAYLHGQLARKNIPWRPRRFTSKVSTPSESLIRKQSGVMDGRETPGNGLLA
jgi:hypothetical protein